MSFAMFSCCLLPLRFEEVEYLPPATRGQAEGSREDPHATLSVWDLTRPERCRTQARLLSDL